MATLPDHAQTLRRWLIAAFDHSGDVAGWIDEDGKLTNAKWHAASFPTHALAMQARTSRHVRRATTGLALRALEVD